MPRPPARRLSDFLLEVTSSPGFLAWVKGDSYYHRHYYYY